MKPYNRCTLIIIYIYTIHNSLFHIKSLLRIMLSHYFLTLNIYAIQIYNVKFFQVRTTNTY